METAAPTDEGFSMIEVAIAAGVLFSVVLLLAYSGVVALIDVSHSRQRQAATGLANEALEQVRALPFGMVSLGLQSADLGSMSDPNITRTGSPSAYVYSYRGETIPHGAHPSRVPLAPHQRTISVEQTDYTVATYVTRHNNLASTNTLRVSVEVTWEKPMRQGTAAKVEAQTVLHAGVGCQSAAAHPYAGPCLAFFDAEAVGQPGSVEITGTINGVPINARLYLPNQRSSLTYEQVALTQGLAETAGTQLSAPSGDHSAGRNSVATTADTDPSSNPGVYENGFARPQMPSHFRSDPATALVVTGSSLDVASASSTAAASASTAPCQDVTGISQDDGEPCSRATVEQPTTMDATLAVEHPDLTDVAPLATFLSAGMTQPAAKQFGFADRTSSSSLHCTATTDGCAHARAAREISDFRVGGLPVTLTPSGWRGYAVRLSGFSDTVEASSGVGVGAPSAQQAGLLEFWDGSEYEEIDLSDSSHPEIVSTGFDVRDGGVNLEIAADLTVGRGSVDAGACDPAPCTLTSARAVTASPLRGEISYRLVINGAVIADLVMRIDLGGLSATGSYKAAPVAA